MVKILIYCFDKWWRPVLFSCLATILFILSEFIHRRVFSNISFVLFGLGLLGLLISIIYQLAKRRWIGSVLTFLLLGGSIAAYIFYSIVIFFIEQDSPDRFADNLKIPANLLIENPIDMEFDKRSDTLANKKFYKTDFQLYNSFQPGLYEYDFWTGKIESGTIYLKAYEITQEYPLSADRLPERSAIKISNSSDSISRFSTTGNFTIYEGDWDKPYAARFEVWFKPDNGKQERKLFQKNYKIEGWQR